jgi:predicted nucleic acid-binding protein
MLTERFDDALVFARQRHNTQTRKGSDTPYVSHLLGVSSLVLESGGDEDQAIAGLLHDTLEDFDHTGVTFDELVGRFGDRVARIVHDHRARCSRRDTGRTGSPGGALGPVNAGVSPLRTHRARPEAGPDHRHRTGPGTEVGHRQPARPGRHHRAERLRPPVTTVVDASVVVAFLVDEGPDGAWAAEALASGGLAAPHLLPVEVAGMLHRAGLTRAISDTVAALAHADLLDIPMILYPYEPLAHRIWSLRANVTSYDAWYVALAEALDAPLATLDLRLAASVGPECSFVTPGR